MPETPQRTRRRGSRLARAALPLLACALTLGLCAGAAAEPVPSPLRLAYATGAIVPIPDAIPHEEGDMIDRRIVPDLRWIAQRYPIYITDGYSGPLTDGEHIGCHNCHVTGSDHYNGLAVDIVPLEGGSKCDSSWLPIARLARWAEPRQNQPIAPFRWVGYNGDAGHGCGNHLHLSWYHSPAPRYQLAEWVEVFPAGAATVGDKSSGKRPDRSKAPSGPAGGLAQAPTGGVSSHGFGD